MDIDTLPPHEPESEWMLLACLCNKPEILSELSQDLFYLAETQKVLQVVTSLHESSRQIDMFSVPVALRGLKLFEVMTKLMEADQALHSASNYPYWLDILKEYRAARQVQALATKAQGMVANLGVGDRPDLLNVAEQFRDIGVAAQTSGGGRSIMRLVEDISQELTDRQNSPEVDYGIKSGFHDLDRLTLGFRPGELVVIGARPGQGKTAIGLQMALAAALQQRAPALFFSLEMTAVQLLERALNGLCRFNMRKFLGKDVTDEDWRQFAAASACLSGCPLHIRDDLSHVGDIASVIAREVGSNGIKLVVVDYLQRLRMSGSRENFYTQVGMISNQLKDAAMGNKVPIVVLAQLSRDVEKEDRKPRLSDLRDSGVIEQDADLILFLHHLQMALEDPHLAPVELIVSKHRRGAVGTIRLLFRKNITMFEAIAPSAELESSI